MKLTSQPKNAINYESKYVSKKTINDVPVLMKQAPNRVGNQSTRIPDANGGRKATVGATNVTANIVRMAQPKGCQGAPKANGVPVPKPHPNGTRSGVTNAGKVMVDQPPKKYAPTNLGFIAKNHMKFGG